MRSGDRHNLDVQGRSTAVVSLCLVALAVCSCSGTRGPHGDPDPGGKRFAALTNIARLALPTDASATHLSLTKSTWGKGGCDGGPPGWTNMRAVETFHAPGDVPTKIDARMKGLHWRDVTAESLGLEGSVKLGPDLPYARQYEPSPDPETWVAWLFRPTHSGGAWELDLQVAPAEVPDHDC